jgi:anti-anti-sigma regulatory factor
MPCSETDRAGSRFAGSSTTPYPPKVIEAFASPAALRGGDHALALTRTDDDLAWFARAFVEHAERAGARALYLSAGPADEVARLGLPRPRHPGGLIVVDAAPVLAPGDLFRPEIYVRALEAAVDAALRDGFAGAHLLVEGGWTLAAIRDVQVWWELEDMAHELGVLQRGDTVLVCQFGQDRFPPQALERAERAHPLSVAASSTGFTPSAPMRVERREGVLHVSGELDRGTAGLLATACRGSVGTVSIDLAEATFFDVGAHRAVTKIAKSCKRVRLRNAPPIVQRVVFALAGEAGLEIEVEDDAVSMRAG